MHLFMYLNIPLEKFGLDEKHSGSHRVKEFDKKLSDKSTPVVTLAQMEQKEPDERLKFVFDTAVAENYLPPERGFGQFKAMFNLLKINVKALAAYEPLPIEGSILYFYPDQPKERNEYSALWQSLPQKEVMSYRVPGDHFLEKQNAGIMVEIIKKFL